MALLAPTASVAQPAAGDAERQNAVVRDALATYNSALKDLHQKGGSVDPQSPIGRTAAGGTRELTLEESVTLALERNLDIQVARLEPGSVDLQIAGINNTFRPTLNTTLGMDERTNLPTSTLVGTSGVNRDQTTYNFGVSQPLKWGGGEFSLGWNNLRAATTDRRVNFNPSYTSSFLASMSQPLIRGFRIDNTRQQLQVAVINRDISDLSVRATIAQTVANVRNAYWDLVFARSSVEVARRALELADALVRDNQARVEVGTLAPLDIVQAQAEAATRRQTLAAAEATASTADLALKRFLVNGTEDPLWRQELVPIDLPSLAPAPTDVEGAIKRAIGERSDLETARRNLDVNDVNLRFFQNQSMPALDLTATYGAQGIGGTQFIRDGGSADAPILDTIPGGFRDALTALSARDYPNWNLAVTMSYPIMGNQADAQVARTRVQRQQAQTRIKALEVQVAAEVANAAFTVQSNLKRVEASTAARELAQKRLEAEQSRFEVGLTTNFFVVQAQRDLRDAENTELRALADYRKSLVTFERAQQAPAGGGGGNSSTNTGGGNNGTNPGGGGQ
jgi:outer membrane protein